MIGNNLILKYIVPPFPSVAAASPINSNNATLNGTVSSADLPATWYFQYGLTTNYGNFTSTNTLGATNGAPVARQINGLAPATLYHFSLVAANNAGSSVSPDMTFTTAPLAPVVTTLAASTVTTNSATLNGTVNPGGGVTTWYFQYGYSTSYGYSSGTSNLAASFNTATVSNSISGLVPGTIYHASLVAANGSRTVSGSDVTFTTVGVAPTAQTLAVTGVSATNATLNASITPGSYTTYYFDYGTTISYGNSTAGGNLSAGTTPVPVSEATSGWTPATQYHVRVVAFNGSGTAYGGDVTFTTPIGAPSATTRAASGITASNATLNASINPDGAATSYYFQYGLTTNYGSLTAINNLSTGNTPVTVSNALSGLPFGTQYHVRVVASNTLGTVSGADVTFTTGPIAPTSQTLAASGLTSNNATLNASINPDGGITAYYFQYGATTNYGSFTATNSLAAGTNSLPVSDAISGLSPGTQYHTRVIASNSSGAVSGADVSFTTLVAPPKAQTQAATGITSSNTTLNASINPGGGVTSYYFQYGPTTNYGSFTTTNSLPAGISPVGVSNTLSNLSAGTLYHFQAVAVNSAGTNFGSDVQFTTYLILSPNAVTLPASGIATTNATLNGTVSSGGAPTAWYFQYGPDTNYGSFTPTNSLVPTGSALRFDGVSQSVSTPQNTFALGFASFTVEFWARRDGMNRYDLAVVQGTGVASQTLHIGFRPSNVFTFGFWGDDLDTPNAYTDNGWHHWACTFDFNSQNKLIYRDGIVVASAKSAQPYMGTGQIAIAVCSANSTWFGGSLDDIRIWLGVRSSSQIFSNLNSELTGTQPNLQFNWKFDEGSGNTTADATGNSNTGTLVNSPTWLPAGNPLTVSNAISGLTPGTLYHAQLVAANAVGNGMGGDITFTTPAAPVVLTQSATAITTTNATVNASINPASLATSYYFQYGTTTNYGSITSTNSLAAGASPVSVNSTLSSLSAGTLYHFQVVAANSVGLVNGNDLTFTTLAQAIPATLQQPVMLTNGVFQFSFTNYPGTTFSVLSSTTLSLELSNWIVLGSAQEVSPGQFQFTDLQATNHLQRFYTVRSP